MKKLSLLLFCTLLFSLSSWAQVTITQGTFPRQGSFIDTFFNAGSSSISAPSHGNGQSWDYTSATSGSPGLTTYMDASGDPNFSGALNYRERDLTFQVFPIESNEYEAIDANGWYFLGRTITDVRYPIGGITGSASDTLRFVGGNYTYSGPRYQVQFPMAYQDQWILDYQVDLDFELTVAAAFLNQAPGTQSRYIYQEREVVGEGTVRIPDMNGQPSQPIDALLLRVVRTTVDSVFIGGSPAPSSLMTTFGLTQGAMTMDSFYVMYSPGFGGPVLSMNIGANNSVSGLFYRPGAARLGTSTSLNDMAIEHFSLSPNPVLAGNAFNIKFDEATSIHSIQIIGLNGQVIVEEPVSSDAGNTVTVAVPDAAAGVYLLNLKDETGSIIGNRMIQVN